MGNTPLHLSILLERIQIYQLLLERKDVDPNEKNKVSALYSLRYRLPGKSIENQKKLYHAMYVIIIIVFLTMSNAIIYVLYQQKI